MTFEFEGSSEQTLCERLGTITEFSQEPLLHNGVWPNGRALVLGTSLSGFDSRHSNQIHQLLITIQEEHVMFCYIEKLSHNIEGNSFIALFWHAYSRPRQNP